MTDPSGLLFLPGALTVALLCGLAWGWRSRWSAAPRRFLLAVAVFYTIAGLGIVPITIGRAIAAGYERLDSLPRTEAPTAIVVLGAGTETAQGWQTRLPVLTPPSAARALEAARLFQLTDPALVISSGGEADRATGQTGSGVLMFDALVRLGVPASRIVVESRSLNTRQQVEQVSPLLRERGIERLVLVTSDLHMRRAEGAFRAEGWTPVAAPAPDVFGVKRSRDYWAPGFGLGQSAQVAHEIVGLTYYFVRGWWRA